MRAFLKNTFLVKIIISRHMTKIIVKNAKKTNKKERPLRESNPQLILRSKKLTQQIQKGSGFPYHLFENSLTYSLSYNVHQSHIQDQEFSFLSILEEETIMLGFQKEYLRCFIFTYLFITFIKCFVIIYS